MTPLHQELANLSQANAAGYIKKDSFAYFTLGRLMDAAKRLRNKAIPAGSGKLSASLRDIVWAAPHPNATLAPPRSTANPGLEVDLLISSSFDVIFDIFITGDPTSLISEVVMSFDDARTHLRAEDNLLIFEGADFDVIRHINPVAGADVLLANAGIDAREAAHIEGHLGYGVVSQAVTGALAARHEIPLSTVFPSVNFGTSIKLAILQNGEALGIVPTDIVTINAKGHCECSEGPDLGRSETELPDMETLPTDAGPNTEFGRIVIGGPTAENKDPMKDFGPRFANGDGEVGLYIPHAFAKSLVDSPMASITFPAADDSSVIGFNARATVAFKNSRVSFDLNGGGLLLDLDLDISVSAYCDFEVFKGVRLPIGWAIIMPAQGSNARLQLGFYPSVDSSGTVKLKSTLNKCDMGSYVAVVIGVGTALKLLGVTAWLGFLIDVVLSTILSLGLPIALKREVSKYMANKEWRLVDGLPVINPADNMFPSAPFDVTESSILASLNMRG